MAVKLMMHRPSLDGIPTYEPPEDYRLRWYREGDENIWNAIQRAADHFNDISDELFSEAFGTDVDQLGRRVAFLDAEDGKTVGTAAAWSGSGRRVESGRVHWVAIHPDFQGRGLSKVLMTAVLERLRELGHVDAYLTTSSARLPALRLYRHFGFLPYARTAEEEMAWSSLALH